MTFKNKFNLIISILIMIKLNDNIQNISGQNNLFYSYIVLYESINDS